ncbi:hypothetical protein Tco_1059032, partial [Tanacetum coccineum]
LPEPKSSYLVEDDRTDEPIVQDLNGSSSLQVNVSDKGYPKSLKEARGHPIEQVISELNERTLSWKTRIIHYIKGKGNGEMLIDLIEKVPYKHAKEITIKATDGVTDITREQTPYDLAPKDRLRYDSIIKAVHIILLGLTFDIYTIINHYQTAKEIWDRVKELMEATENAIFMASISSARSLNDDTVTPTYDSNILSEVPHYDTYHDDVLNSDVQEMKYNEHFISHDDSYAEVMSDNNVISYAEYMVTIQDEVDHYVPPPV